MTTPDEEVSYKVSEKLTALKSFNTKTIDKIVSWIKDGNITSYDLIILLETQRSKNKDTKIEDVK